MGYGFPWIAIEGFNGAGKTTLMSTLSEELGSRSQFVHEPPKEGIWSEIFAKLSPEDKLARRPDVMLSYLACSLAQQHKLEWEPVDLLISDRSFISTLSFFSNIEFATRKKFVSYHYLPNGVIFLSEDRSILDHRLRERVDSPDQTAFNEFYVKGYREVLPWIRDRGCPILELTSSLMSKSELKSRVMAFVAAVT